MTGTAAADDLYETGRAWHCDEFAARWRVDAAKLHRALNLCAFGMKLPGGHQSPAQRRGELTRIAATGQAFARALADAGDDTIVFLLETPRELRNDLLLHPDRHRQKIVGQVRKIAERAGEQVVLMRVNQKPASTVPTRDERQVVSAFAFFSYRMHGAWPKVTMRKGGKGADRRVANEAGRFVIDAAEKFFSMTLTDQRLRTVLASLQPPTAET